MLAPRLVRFIAATTALTLAGLVLLALLTPSPSAFTLVPPTAGHFTLFLALGMALGAWRAAGPRRNAAAELFLLLAVLLLFASLSEIAQIWIDGRAAQMGDWLADAAGAVPGLILGAAVALLLTARRRASG